MTPTDILAAARLSPLSPVVPAREEWLKDWIGPALAPTGAKNGGSIEVAIVGTDGGRAYWYCIEADRFDFGDGEDLRLDLRRPEVRDRLVRCGAPEWCQDNVAGMLAWALGGRPDDDVFRPLTDEEKVSAVSDARCVLTDSDGWYIPLPGGAVGWLPKENA